VRVVPTAVLCSRILLKRLREMTSYLIATSALGLHLGVPTGGVGEVTSLVNGGLGKSTAEARGHVGWGSHIIGQRGLGRSMAGAEAWGHVGQSGGFNLGDGQS
jgi:hypothetical protein